MAHLRLPSRAEAELGLDPSILGPGRLSSPLCPHTCCSFWASLSPHYGTGLLTLMPLFRELVEKGNSSHHEPAFPTDMTTWPRRLRSPELGAAASAGDWSAW